MELSDKLSRSPSLRWRRGKLAVFTARLPHWKLAVKGAKYAPFSLRLHVVNVGVCFIGLFGVARSCGEGDVCNRHRMPFSPGAPGCSGTVSRLLPVSPDLGLLAFFARIRCFAGDLIGIRVSWMFRNFRA